MFTYSTSPPVANKTKLNLNKRVAFPMQSSVPGSSNIAATTKVQTSGAGLPMPFARVKQQPPPPLAPTQVINPVIPSSPPKFPPAMIPNIPPPSTTTHTIIPEPSEMSAESILDIHNIVLSALHSAIASLALDSVKSEEIVKRLEILSSMWLDNRFDAKLIYILSKIAKGISIYEFQR